MDLLRPKRSARISPDRPSVGIISIVLVFLVMIASMTFSFAALRDAARWTGAPEWALFLAPIYIDGSILAYTVALSIFRWRSEPVEAKSAQRWLRAFTAFSSIVNGMHAASSWGWDYLRYEMWGGTTIAVLAPIAALVSAEQIIRLVFQKEHEEDVVPEAEVPSVEAQADTSSEPALIAEPMDESTAHELPAFSEVGGGTVSAENTLVEETSSMEATGEPSDALITPLEIADHSAEPEPEPEPDAKPLPVDSSGLFELPVAN